MDKLTREERKEYNRKHGISRELKVFREGETEVPHPSKGGSRGFPTWYKDKVVEMKKLGLDVAHLASERSVRRWKNERIIAYTMTGNKGTSGLPGHHRLLLALFKKVYPQATSEQCTVFLACHSHDHAVFTNSEISRALSDMAMTVKRSSTTANQAFSPDNLERHFRFWKYPFPAGIRRTPRKLLIDVDEMAVELKDAGLNYGHAVRGMRVRKIGNYGRGKIKFTLIMAIEAGDPDPSRDPDEEGTVSNPRLWYKISTDAGTTTENYVTFLNKRLMDKFDPNESQRTIMHDNLSSHKADEVVEAIHSRGHRVICRPPYRPHEAPIEWAFDMFAAEVRRRWEVINDEQDLCREMHNILQSKSGLGGFDSLFEECGYRWV